VKGTVKTGGTLANSGQVTFHGANGTTRTAKIGSNGEYSALDVPVGDAKVTVTGPTPDEIAIQKRLASAPVKDETGTAGPSGPLVPINAKYADVAKSGLSFTVKAGENTNDIALDK